MNNTLGWRPAGIGSIQSPPPAVRGIPTASTQIRPEFFALPPRGGDAYFGLSRSTYYDLERAGLLRLVRLRKPGNLRGKVLVPYDDVRALLSRLNQEP
jgi:hypothetical protein